MKRCHCDVPEVTYLAQIPVGLQTPFDENKVKEEFTLKNDMDIRSLIKRVVRANLYV